MNYLAKRVAMAGIGMALMLSWWTLRDKVMGSSQPAASDSIPAKVWEGGGSTVTIDVESSDPAIMRANFAATDRREGTPVRSLDTYEKVPAGKHSWTVDVPSAVGADLEFQADSPKPGSHLVWTVRSGEKVLAQESETLKEPLGAREAFFLSVNVDDFSNIERPE